LGQKDSGCEKSFSKSLFSAWRIEKRVVQWYHLFCGVIKCACFYSCHPHPREVQNNRYNGGVNKWPL